MCGLGFFIYDVDIDISEINDIAVNSTDWCIKFRDGTYLSKHPQAKVHIDMLCANKEYIFYTSNNNKQVNVFDLVLNPICSAINILLNENEHLHIINLYSHHNGNFIVIQLSDDSFHDIGKFT